MREPSKDQAEMEILQSAYEDGEDLNGEDLNVDELEKGKWIIKCWAGKRRFPDKVFDGFEEAWGFIRETFPDAEDWQEYEVERLADD